MGPVTTEGAEPVDDHLHRRARAPVGQARVEVVGHVLVDVADEAQG